MASDGNIAKLKHGDIDAIITSPPYSEGQFDCHHGIKGPLSPNLRGRKVWEQRFKMEYSDGNITNLKHGNIDEIITSPPYEGSMEGGSRHTGGKCDREKSEEETRLKIGLGVKYSDDERNIGNLKKETYLEAMFKVYHECYKVLKPQGLLIVVIKDFIRNKKVVPLHEHTIKLCELVGFRLKEHLLFELPTKSFWRILYEEKHPEVDTSPLKYEHVLVFTKSGDT